MCVRSMRALLASMDDVILILDRDGRYIEIVPTNPQLLYRPAEGLVGRYIRDVFPPDEARLFREDQAPMRWVTLAIGLRVWRARLSS